MTDSEADIQTSKTPRRQQHHQQQEEDSSVRRCRRSVNLDDSDEPDARVPQLTRKLGDSESSVLKPCTPPRRRSSRLASLANGAEATPQRITEAATASTGGSPVRGTPTEALKRTLRVSRASPRTPGSSCRTKRLRRVAPTPPRPLPGAPEATPAEADASVPRPRRRSRPLFTNEEDSDGDVGVREEEERGGSGRSSKRMGTLQLAVGLTPRDANAASVSSSRRSAADYNSSDTDKAPTARSSSCSPLPRPSRRLRKQPQEQKEKPQQPEAKECGAVGPLGAAPGARPSQKELQQRLQLLAKKVKEKACRSQASRGAQDDQVEAESGSESDGNDAGSPKALGRSVAPRSARRASKVRDNLSTGCSSCCCQDLGCSPCSRNSLNKKEGQVCMGMEG